MVQHLHHLLQAEAKALRSRQLRQELCHDQVESTLVKMAFGPIGLLAPLTFAFDRVLTDAEGV